LLSTISRPIADSGHGLFNIARLALRAIEINRLRVTRVCKCGTERKSAHLYAAASFARDLGHQEEAVGYATRLAQLEPDDPDIQRFLSQIQQ